MNQINIKLLEYKEGVYEGAEYSNVIARYQGKLLRFKLDKKRVPNLESLLDKDVLATFDIVSGGNMSATIRITGVEVAK